ncbi:uncharacterized protein LOC109719782 [Ananas comosus]|uniref:Uncharacterized protein LOC109719782 n=1 Tax=Ananas comosus TaxID=4615 RepID=A0A6P5G0P1_ANACO|nr:uncharacterized protein LOC109719782 [Ananas comosus]
MLHIFSVGQIVLSILRSRVFSSIQIRYELPLCTCSGIGGSQGGGFLVLYRLRQPPLTFLPHGNVERRLVYVMRHAVNSIGHLMDDPPEPTRMMDTLAHVRWDLKSVLKSLPTLPVTGYPDVSSPTFGDYGDIPFTSTHAYDFGDIPSTSAPAYDFGDIPSTSAPAYDFGDIPSTSMPAYDFPSTSVSIHPSDVPSTSNVLPTSEV